MKLWVRVWAIVVLGVLAPTVGAACGTNSQCKVGDRHYYISLPDNYDGRTKIPALFFAHGLQGSALGTIRNTRLRQVSNDLGIALIAIKSLGVSWASKNAPTGNARRERAEFAYLDAVAQDATKRFAIDGERLVMAGASTGGMFTWNVACHRSDAFAAFIPMSGTFWTPQPARCKGPVTSIVHFHGDNDQTVPLTGRFARGVQQGSVPKSLAMYRAYGDFRAPRSRRVSGLKCENSRNRKKDILNFCLYSGGHSFRSSNVGVAWKMLQAAGKI
jgi:polyhydroxybutyrate depolymerase